MAEEDQAAIAERMRNCEMGVSLVLKNCRDALVVYTGADGCFSYTANNHTWAIGAVRRVMMSLDERERIDTRRLDDDEDANG